MPTDPRNGSVWCVKCRATDAPDPVTGKRDVIEVRAGDVRRYICTWCDNYGNANDHLERPAGDKGLPRGQLRRRPR